MTAWNSTLLRGWYPVAEARRLRDKPMRVTVFGRAVVLARLPSGSLLALDDRCPHRHVPLSDGQLVGETLQCKYHGWTFGADGRCNAMPGMCPGAAVPAVQVNAWQAFEHDGLIWMSARAPGEAAPAALPAFLNCLPAGSRRFLWSTLWRARPVDALENFLDPLHTHLVHPGLVRSHGARQPMTVTLTQSAEGLRVTYAGQAQQSGLLYRLFESPRSMERAHFGTAAPASAQLEYRYANGSALYFTLHFTPEDEMRTRVFGTLHVEKRWAPAWAVRAFVWPFLYRVAEQDRRVVEAQAANSVRFGRQDGISTELDLVRPMLDAVWMPNGKPVEPGERMMQMWL
ncbi:MAG: Rieske 2Fe-2S domain-containing protein [Ralstonia sp.]|uniref:Rieske 2Fe-2S domain-containing protein n=1 Tax=Ralstonia sp. TaxID=54061 RepID=UPI003F7E5CD7